MKNQRLGDKRKNHSQGKSGRRGRRLFTEGTKLLQRAWRKKIMVRKV